MKKLLSILLINIMLFFIIGCGNTNNNISKETNITIKETESYSEDSKIEDIKDYLTQKYNSDFSCLSVNNISSNETHYLFSDANNAEFTVIDNIGSIDGFTDNYGSVLYDQEASEVLSVIADIEMEVFVNTESVYLDKYSVFSIGSLLDRTFAYLEACDTVNAFVYINSKTNYDDIANAFLTELKNIDFMVTICKIDDITQRHMRLNNEQPTDILSSATFKIKDNKILEKNW